MSRRYGGDTSNPSAQDGDTAIEEFYTEDLLGMTEADYAEHGAGWIRYGYDNGPMFVLEVSRLGTIRLEEWADQDFEEELAPARERMNVPRELALQLCRWMISGDHQKIRDQAGI